MQPSRFWLFIHQPPALVASLWRQEAFCAVFGLEAMVPNMTFVEHGGTSFFSDGKPRMLDWLLPRVSRGWLMSSALYHAGLETRS